MWGIGVQRAELEEVKRERAALMSSLAALKGEQAQGGGELQQQDIARLRRDLHLKRHKLNQLKQVPAPLRL